MITKYDRKMMETALLWAELSSSRELKVGAVLARDNRILAIGFNGTVPGMDNACEDVIEIWKSFKDFDLNYKVSNLGQVRSDRILVPRLAGAGYFSVNLMKEGKPVDKYIHRLVAEAFITNKLNLSDINHIDNDKSNNNLLNLEYCTHRKNCYQREVDKGIECPGTFQCSTNTYGYHLREGDVRHKVNGFKSRKNAHEAYLSRITELEENFNTTHRYEGTDIYRTKSTIIHAEENILIQCAREGTMIKGAVLYCTHAPCISCACKLASLPLSVVYYKTEHKHGLEAMQIFKDSNIDIIKMEI